MALTLAKLGRNQEALNCKNQYYQFKKETLGNNHLETIFCILDIGMTFLALHKQIDALNCFKDSTKLFEANFGKKHPTVTYAVSLSFETLIGMGKHEEAFELMGVNKLCLNFLCR